LVSDEPRLVTPETVLDTEFETAVSDEPRLVTPETALDTELETAVSDEPRLVTPEAALETESLTLVRLVETLPSEVDTPSKLVETLT
jgi:hypothetical protein